MYLPLLAGVVVFVAAALASSHIVRSSLARLGEDDKVRLLDRLSASRSAVGLFVYTGLVGLWFWAFLSLPAHARTVHLVFIAAVFGLLVAFVARSHRRTETLPDDFRRAMLHASVLRAAGFAALVLAVAWPLVAAAGNAA